jgi:hypothetical protein
MRPFFASQKNQRESDEFIALAHHECTDEIGTEGNTGREGNRVGKLRGSAQRGRILREGSELVA